MLRMSYLGLMSIYELSLQGNGSHAIRPAMQGKVTENTLSLDIDGVELRAKRLQLEEPSLVNGPLLVFLHQGLGSIAQWRDYPLAVSLTTGLPALIYERQGYGESAALAGPLKKDYLIHHGLAVLPKVLELFQEDQFILIGHSDGGSIAMVAASDDKQRANILGVVSEAAHCFCEPSSKQGVQKLVDDFEKGKLKTALEKFHPINLEQTFYAWANVWRSDEFANWDIRDRLANIKCPLLAIHGNDDENCSVRQIEVISAHCRSDLTLKYIENCAHIPHHQQRKQVLDSIVPFVKALLPLN